MSYHQWQDQNGEFYGCFEVFWDIPEPELDGEEVGAGYYWWPAYPGCLPDGDPIGPFETREEALADALEH